MLKLFSHAAVLKLANKKRMFDGFIKYISAYLRSLVHHKKIPDFFRAISARDGLRNVCL
jgi:hypothetical protein